jgi:ABC-type transport system involved in cytochrome c biogenesis permease subunit
MNAFSAVRDLQSLVNTVAVIGVPLQWFVVGGACVLIVVAVLPPFAEWRSLALGAMTALLVIGEGVLVWFHIRLYQLTPLVDPSTHKLSGHMAVSLWVEGERLYVWALTVAILGMLLRKQREHLLPGVMLSVGLLSIVGILSGSPFSNPLPTFLAQYSQYLQAMAIGGGTAAGAWQGMEATRQFYYNAWFMWVHPPLLYFSYAAFTVSFVAIVQMIRWRYSGFETIAYGWARLGYLPLTVGMLIGFPWALEAWTGESWWWSGFVNMSIMMWLFYTAYLHARLYLRRKNMWRLVAALGALSFGVLVLTYIATYVVPGAHSYAAMAPGAEMLFKTACLACRGGLA